MFEAEMDDCTSGYDITSILMTLLLVIPTDFHSKKLVPVLKKFENHSLFLKNFLTFPASCAWYVSSCNIQSIRILLYILSSTIDSLVV